MLRSYERQLNTYATESHIILVVSAEGVRAYSRAHYGGNFLGQIFVQKICRVNASIAPPGTTPGSPGTTCCLPLDVNLWLTHWDRSSTLTYMPSYHCILIHYLYAQCLVLPGLEPIRWRSQHLMLGICVPPARSVLKPPTCRHLSLGIHLACFVLRTHVPSLRVRVLVFIYH